MLKPLFWLTLLTLLGGLLMRIPVEGAGILLADVLLPLLAGSFVLYRLVVVRSWPQAPFWIPGLVFGLWATFTWLWGAWDLSLSEKALSASYLVRWFSFIILGVMVADWAQDRAWKDSTFNSLVWIVLGIVGVGFLQFFLLPDIGVWSTVGGFDPHQGRLLGTWMDPNFVAGLLAFFLPVVLGKYYEKFLLGKSPELPLSRRLKGDWLYLSLLFLGLVAVFLTFSRSGYVAFGVGMVWFLLWRDPKWLLVGALVACLGLASSERAQKRVGELAGTLKAVVLQETNEVDPTAKLRVKSWQASLTLWEKTRWLGIGYNTYRFRAAEEGIVDESYFSAGGSDSTLLTLLVTTGVGGVLLFAWFYAGLFVRAFARFLRSGNSTSLGLSAGLLALLVHSVFVNSLLFPLIFILVIVVVGLEKRD